MDLQSVPTPDGGPIHPPRLTRRERQVVDGVVRGLTNRQIAAELNLSEQTIKNMLCALFDKVGVRSRVQLAIYATRNGV